MEDPVAILHTLLASRSDEVVVAMHATCKALRKAAPDACEHIFETHLVSALFTFTGKAGGSYRGDLAPSIRFSGLGLRPARTLRLPN